MYSSILNYIVLPLGEFLRGTNVLGHLKQLEQSQWWTSAQIRQLQQEKLERLLYHAYENVPYYRRVFEERSLKPADIASIEDLSKLPILTKEEARRQLPDQIVARNCRKKDYLHLASSGSTGEPFRFYLSKQAHDARLAAMFRYWRAIGYDFGVPWVRVQRQPREKLIDRLYDRLVRCLYIPFCGVDKETLGQQIEQIRRARPDIIRGYPPALYLMAKFAKDNDIRLVSPKAVITTGDTLFDHYREAIETQFACKVFDNYGGEGIVIAGQCEYGAYHINAEGVIVEFIKSDGQPARPGELGEIVLTDLNNYAMPFIRYKIGDIGVPSDKMCSCGRGLPFMDSIKGRDTDIVVTPEGRYLTDHFFMGLIKYIDGVNQFQVIQHEIDHLEIKIVRNDRFTDQGAHHIEKTIRQRGGEGLGVELNFVDDIPVSKSGKRRFVISEVGQEYFSP